MNNRNRGHSRKVVAAVVVIGATLAGCEQDPLVPEGDSSSHGLEPTLQWRAMSDADLSAAIESAGGRVFIGLKDPQHTRGVDARGRLLASPTRIADGKAEIRGRGVAIIREFPLSPTVVADVPPGLVTALRHLPHVDYIEPITRGWFLSQDTTWNIERVRAPQGWLYGTGTPDVRVLVLDTGTDPAHPDLDVAVRNRCSINGEVGGSGDDDSGHGTFVTGIIGAVNNDIGIIGGAPGITVMSMRIGTTETSSAAIVCGIQWGRQNGVFVMNMSFFADPSEAVTNEINLAYGEGRLLVAAAGNAGGPVEYPASLPNVMAVSSTRFWLNSWAGGNWGPEIEIAAPGEDVYSTARESGTCGNSLRYGTCSGTSFAAPHVTFAAALVKSVSPGLTAVQVRARLQSTALDLGEPGRDETYGYGLLDVGAAISNYGGGSGISGVDIVGPICLYGPGYYTFEGQTSGGTPPYSYQWYRDIAPYEGTWENLGTGQVKAMYFPTGDYSARLRLRSTDNVGHVRETIEYVQMISSGGAGQQSGFLAKLCAGDDPIP